jgi:hypothetical protein
MKKNNFIKTLLFIGLSIVLFQSCKSYIWGKTADERPTKFNSDTRYIKRN